MSAVRASSRRSRRDRTATYRRERFPDAPWSWWSDGDVGEALRWFAFLFTEGDLLGKTEAQLRSLHFKRDRGYLRS